MRWEFKQEPRAPHRWRWQRVDSESGSVSMISDALFKTLQECVRASKIATRDNDPPAFLVVPRECFAQCVDLAKQCAV